MRFLEVFAAAGNKVDESGVDRLENQNKELKETIKFRGAADLGDKILCFFTTSGSFHITQSLNRLFIYEY